MKILLYLHSGSLNHGCEAIVRTAVKVLHQNFGKENTEISLASFAPETDKAIPEIKEVWDMSPKPVESSIDKLKISIYFKIFKNDRLFARITHKEFIGRIKKYDLFLSIGGDSYCYGEQPVWYELNRQIKLQNKKMILWGCSIGEEDLSEEKLNDLKTFNAILARERLTFNLLKNKGLEQTHWVADGAFLLEKEELPLPKKWLEGKMVGMNFSPLVYQRNPKAKEAFENLVAHILETTDYHIAFTPHVTIDGNNDYEILNEISQKFEKTGKVLVLPDNLNAIQYKGYISKMNFFIGARTHATIAAYSSGVPTMVLGYSVKSKGIATDIFGEEKLVLGVEEISDAKKLITKFEEMKNEEFSLKEILKNKIPEIKKRAEKAGKYLKL